MLLIKISDTIFFIFQTLLKKAASKSYKKRRPIGMHSLVFLDKVAPTRNLAIGGDVGAEAECPAKAECSARWAEAECPAKTECHAKATKAECQAEAECSAKTRY